MSQKLPDLNPAAITKPADHTVVRSGPSTAELTVQGNVSVRADLTGPLPILAERRLRDFTGAGYDKGRSILWQAAWFAVMNLVFMQWWLPSRFRPAILRAFGADVGERVLIRHRVRVQWPWKLSIGDDCWVGEGVWLINLEPITVDHDVCLSQEALLCTGSHQHRDPTFEFDNRPIQIRAGAWVAARAIVLGGADVASGEVVSAGVVRKHQSSSRSGQSPNSSSIGDPVRDAR
jgi:putative colanic acid biosynthesis acetyltransferase WcaF